MRGNTIAAPVVREGRRVVLVLGFELEQPRLQVRAVGDDGTLVRDERAETTAERAALEVAVRFLGAGALHRADDPDLALQFGPVEDEGGDGILGQFAPLLAL